MVELKCISDCNSFIDVTIVIKSNITNDDAINQAIALLKENLEE